tara:strand:+ start:199 stop:426 length:228 start_codon:yes stop_codon:yes gene_type:complete
MTQTTSIQQGGVYPISQFKELSGLKHYAFRNAVKKGLKTISIGRRKYVRGSDFLVFLDKQSREQDASEQETVTAL